MAGAPTRPSAAPPDGAPGSSRRAPSPVTGDAPCGAAPPAREQDERPAGVPARSVVRERFAAALNDARRYLLERDPTCLVALAPLAALALLLYTRHPGTNFIFDEQEALLANPYVNARADLGWLAAKHVDFWGLPPERSIGSYRPVPNLVWRAAWSLTRAPFVHHLYNVLLHALNGALFVSLVFAWTRRRPLAWLCGATFVGCAVLTEAVAGIVGLADVLGGLAALLALHALRLPAWGMPFGVFGAVVLGLFSKESVLVCVPLVAAAAVLVAPFTHPERPLRLGRGLLALAAASAAFVVYVELRRRWFPAPLPAELTMPVPEHATALARGLRALLLWFHQAPLPRDPLNNPLLDADLPLRLAGALRVYWRGLLQVLAPRTLSGDYSFPQEPIPEEPWFFESVAGGAAMILPLAAAPALWVVALRRERSARCAVAGGAGLARPWSATLPGRAALRLGALVVLAPTAALALVETMLLAEGPADRVPEWAAALALAAPLMLGFGLLLESRAPPGHGVLGAGGADRSLTDPALVALGLLWVVVSYFPHSNIPVLLPTVRAERFWYLPALGTSLVLGTALERVLDAGRRAVMPRHAFAAVALFFSVQAVQARLHALDYSDDLTFWKATRDAVPRSAKAHLNYSVMQGARRRLDLRLEESLLAVALAPDWPMAHVYTGDALCRLHRADEAWPHYRRGFERGPNEVGLVALALQCLWEEGKLRDHEAELRELAARFPGTHLSVLVLDTLENAETHGGVDRKHRPRSYNEGPKEP